MIINKIKITSPDHIVTQVKGNIVSNMGEEKIMLSVQQGKYYNLGQIGGEIWDLVDGKSSINQIISKLMSEYDIEPVECEMEVLSFLEDLLTERLIEITEIKI